MQTSNVIQFPVWRANPSQAFLERHLNEALAELDSIEKGIAQLETELVEMNAALKALDYAG